MVSGPTPEGYGVGGTLPYRTLNERPSCEVPNGAASTAPVAATAMVLATGK